MLDDIDRLLIRELQKNGRKPLLQISKKANISHVALNKRLTNLIEKGFLSIRANVNLEQINAKMAIITVETENYKRLKELISLFKDCPRTVFLASLSASNLISVIIGENQTTLQNVIGVCSIRAQKGIRRSEVFITDPPIYPKYLPIRISPQNRMNIAPCGTRCDICDSFQNNECLGCPSTQFYRGIL
jgi:Lrp/AsnC family transcriptional regulator for asnA, asnC and gidA